MATLTINEGLTTLKILRARHTELVGLRNQNSARETRFYGTGGDKEKVFDPTYDVKKLDKLITRVATEIRKLEMALKRANAATMIEGYSWDDEVMGQVE